MGAKSGLRNNIENIGKDILKKITLTVTRGLISPTTIKPIMIPPIPESKFIDKLPEGVFEGANVQEKEHQDAYEAEVKIYRCLEDLEKDYLVIHQLEFTHEQYSAFVRDHNCNRKRCKKGPEDHPCHKQPKDIEGECDLLVVGKSFVAICEVKGLNLDHRDPEEDKRKFEGCCESARLQTEKMERVIKSINSFVTVIPITIFPNISYDEYNELDPSGQRLDSIILFNGYLAAFMSLIEDYQKRFILRIMPKSERDELFRCLLGLWCVDQKGKWDLDKFRMTKCIKDVDLKLSKALVTRELVDEERRATCSKQVKFEERIGNRIKEYPKNPEMIEAPKLFKDYLNISCLTQDQLNVFNSDERFLWVEAPAGTGKTITMLGKIIDIVLNKPPRRVLLILSGYKDDPTIKRHFELLNGIASCRMVLYDYGKITGPEKYKKKVKRLPDLSEHLPNTTSRIVLLAMNSPSASDGMYDFITSFDHVFVDDYQHLSDTLFEPRNWSNIIWKGLSPVVDNSVLNNTKLWIFCDEGQRITYKQMVIYHRFHLYKKVDPLKRFKKLFDHHYVSLTVNMRNSYEISTVLSVIRKHMQDDMKKWTDTDTLNLPQQKIGHSLRGTKPVIYLLRDNCRSTWLNVLQYELEKLIGLGSCFEDKDVAVLYDKQENDWRRLSSTLKGHLQDWKTKNGWETPLLSTDASVSAEWAAVICIRRYTFRGASITKSGSSQGLRWSYNSLVVPFLYRALSRARVHSTAIICEYRPGMSQYTDTLLNELKCRTDVCTVIDSTGFN